MTMLEAHVPAARLYSSLLTLLGWLRLAWVRVWLATCASRSAHLRVRVHLLDHRRQTSFSAV
jgi:hypothetical protein